MTSNFVRKQDSAMASTVICAQSNQWFKREEKNLKNNVNLIFKPDDVKLSQTKLLLSVTFFICCSIQTLMVPYCPFVSNSVSTKHIKL